MLDLRRMSQYDVMRRWPRLTAHVVSESLGYASPELAAHIIKDAKLGHENWCEWILTCHRGDPRPVLRAAIRNRHHHRGFIAWNEHALALVRAAIARQGLVTVFGSWC